MLGRSNMLPIALAVVIFMLALIAITAGRSNQPNVAGNDDFPHHVCTFSGYCEGTTCTSEPSSFVLYLEHEDGLPRLEMPRMGNKLTASETASGINYESTGGEVTGTLSLHRNRNFDLVATSVADDATVEHFATGSCERLRTP